MRRKSQAKAKKASYEGLCAQSSKNNLTEARLNWRNVMKRVRRPEHSEDQLETKIKLTTKLRISRDNGATELSRSEWGPKDW